MKKLSPEKRNQLILTIVGTLAMVSMVYFFLIGPQKQENGKLDQETQSLQTKLAQINQTIKQADVTAKNAADIAAKLSQAEADMAGGDVFAWVYDTLRQFKSGYHVDIPNIGTAGTGGSGFAGGFSLQTNQRLASGHRLYPRLCASTSFSYICSRSDRSRRWGVGPLARWKKASLPDIAMRLRWAFAVSLVTALLLPLTLDHWSPMVSFGLLLALWIATSGAVTLLDRIRNTATGSSAWARLRATPRAYYGMLLAHLGVAVFVVGVTLVKGYGVEKDVRMAVGDVTEIGGYTFQLAGIGEVTGPNYVATRATMQVTRNGRSVTTLNPERRVYNVQQMPMTEAAIDTGFARDLYVSLGDKLGPNSWLVRVQHKPFVDWIWGGCVVMALGGFLAATDRRYRVASRQSKESYAAAPPPRPQPNPAG